MSDLAKRLRDENTWLEPEHILAAADRIDVLEAEVTRLKSQQEADDAHAERTASALWAFLQRAEAAEARAEKMREALAAAREAAGERRSYCQAWEWKYKAQWDEEDAAISKALEDGPHKEAVPGGDLCQSIEHPVHETTSNDAQKS